jgi:hypothetical protein
LILFSFSLTEAQPRAKKFSGGSMKKQDDGAPVAVGKAYDFVLWLLPKVENFPRAHRFTVGERLTTHGLDLLTSLVEAAYAREKAGLLEQAGRKVNSTRLLLRMAKDLKLMSMDAYGFSAEKLDEIGRMVGGWSKAAAKA